MPITSKEMIKLLKSNGFEELSFQRPKKGIGAKHS